MIGVDRRELIGELVVLTHVFLPDLLRVVRDEAVPVHPDKLGRDRQDSMAEFLILTGWRNSLQRLDRSDIPYDHLVCLVESEHERSTLNDINADDRLSVTS